MNVILEQNNKQLIEYCNNEFDTNLTIESIKKIFPNLDEKLIDENKKYTVKFTSEYFFESEGHDVIL